MSQNNKVQHSESSQNAIQSAGKKPLKEGLKLNPIFVNNSNAAQSHEPDYLAEGKEASKAKEQTTGTVIVERKGEVEVCQASQAEEDSSVEKPEGERKAPV